MIEEYAKITHVAIEYENKVYSLTAPNRHHDVVRLIAQYNGVGIKGKAIQGFLDQYGEFLTREEAFIRAQHTGQLIRKEGPEYYQGDELFSEDLW